MNRALGQSVLNSMTIPIDKLGQPGTWGAIEVVPVMLGDTEIMIEAKKTRSDEREFLVRIKLSRSPSETTLHGNFANDSGSSFMVVADSHAEIEISDATGTMNLATNAARELSVAYGTVAATTARAALETFMARFSMFTDHVAYQARIPVFIELIVVKDVATEVQTMYFVSPPRPCLVSPGTGSVELEMSPVYALYREAQNATSPYYRVLCLFKIMEGLLGSLKVEMRKRAKSAAVDITTPKVVVPDHPDFPTGLRNHVGTPVKAFFDTFLQKQFRDAMAHFNLNGKAPLNVSEQGHWSRFMDVAFVADLCSRQLIADHELALRALNTGVAKK